MASRDRLLRAWGGLAAAGLGRPGQRTRHCLPASALTSRNLVRPQGTLPASPQHRMAGGVIFDSLGLTRLVPMLRGVRSLSAGFGGKAALFAMSRQNKAVDCRFGVRSDYHLSSARDSKLSGR